ncbi:unnamed protein product, partial [Fusarium graminearum]
MHINEHDVTLQLSSEAYHSLSTQTCICLNLQPQIRTAMPPRYRVCVCLYMQVGLYLDPCSLFYAQPKDKTPIMKRSQD